MVSLEGSMPWILYGLWVRHRNAALSGAAGARGAQWDSDESSRDDRCWSIVRRAAQATGRGGWRCVGADAGLEDVLIILDCNSRV